MQTNDLKKIANNLTQVLKEIGCSIPVSLKDDELVVRDILVFQEVGFFVGISASNPDEYVFKIPDSEGADVVSAVAQITMKGLISRAISNLRIENND